MFDACSEPLQVSTAAHRFTQRGKTYAALGDRDSKLVRQTRDRLELGIESQLRLARLAYDCRRPRGNRAFDGRNIIGTQIVLDHDREYRVDIRLNDMGARIVFELRRSTTPIDAKCFGDWGAIDGFAVQKGRVQIVAAIETVRRSNEAARGKVRRHDPTMRCPTAMQPL